ncbi:MAG TPA: YtxH domain-containing protein [Thermoleophilia bacterium]|nr:YtxH domain-containing protein [Thermoleophilia bacterium]
MKLAGFVLGAAVGAGIAVLLAPKTGKEMRNQLLTGTDWDEQRQRLTDAVSAGREQAMGRSDDLKRKIEETRARLRKQMEEQPQ